MTMMSSEQRDVHRGAIKIALCLPQAFKANTGTALSVFQSEERCCHNVAARPEAVHSCQPPVPI